MTADAWQAAKAVIGDRRVTLGPQASQQWLDAPDHLAMVLARYRAASALIGDAQTVLEVGCGEGIGAGILARARGSYIGLDSDREAVLIARGTYGERPNMTFLNRDVIVHRSTGRTGWDAAIALDVIEHIPAERELAFMTSALSYLGRRGMMVIGTPNAAFDHLASPQSKAGHCNTYTHDRLHALMTKCFRVVQSFGLNDVALHTGHPEARHYLMMVGIGPR